MWSKPGTRPRALSLESALFLTLAYFRHNVTEKFLAPFFGVSQATVSCTMPLFRRAGPGRRRQDCTPGNNKITGHNI
ncbi:helix-turn-helix domain-containing protein [Rathayibacter toxicus]|uniref:helix-turn-helix domain-containing protein n=1 Tax=Rathayibacter toxicus TaxID=145458 RepID=UPI00168CEB6A|nr:transposase family protein [Rathayibacter toxicus]